MTEQAARKYKANREDWGSITDKRKNGRFQASYVGPDGNRYYGPVTYTSRTDARAWLANQRTAIGKGTWRSPKTVNVEVFGVYAKTWVEQRVSRGKKLAPRTRAEYERFLNKGLSEFSKDHLQSITAPRVRTWHATRTRDAGATAAAKEAQVLRAILNTALGDGIIEGQNPVPSDLTRTSTGQSHRPPTPDELATILNVIEPEFRFAVVLAVVGGLRLSEWRCLRRSDFTLREDGRYMVNVTRQAQYIALQGWVVGVTKSPAGVRPIPLSESLTSEVEDHLNRFTGPFPSDLLWAPKGRSEFIHDSAWRDAWNPARDAAGVRAVVREHDLRHYALTSFATTGATLAEVMAYGGHSTAVAAMRYQHAAADRLAELSNMVAPLPKVKPSNVRKIGS